MIQVLVAAIAILKQGLPLVEATVIHHQGSTPRSAGATMIIGADGKSHGTVGGGILEAETFQAAQAVHQTGRSRILSFDLTGKDAADSGMICGGRTQILIDYIAPGPTNVVLFESRLAALQNRTKGEYLTIIENCGDKIHSTNHGLILAGADPAEMAAVIDALPPSLQEQIGLPIGKAEIIRIYSEAGITVVSQTLVIPKTAYLFGAGHVALFTAHLAARVGFRVVVVDDREMFANTERFPHADQILAIDDFSRAMERITIDENAFVVIATRGHAHDRDVLAQAIKTRAAYIGMIGSRRKKETLFTALRVQGFSQKDLDRVHCPIGVPIEAETPEEIAVSIVGEMIQQRALGQR